MVLAGHRPERVRRFGGKDTMNSTRFRAGIFLGLFLLGLTSSFAPAQARGLSLIRDSEIEALLNEYARPIFKAAGLGSGRIAMRIVRNDAFNAFVIDGRNVFVHTGMLMQSETPNQVIGVVAHEAGHIAGGHMASLRHRIKKDQTRALLLQILAVGLMGAGAAAGDRDVAGAGTGLL